MKNTKYGIIICCFDAVAFYKSIIQNLNKRCNCHKSGEHRCQLFKVSVVTVVFLHGNSRAINNKKKENTKKGAIEC
jgi:hypothetical protein